MGRSLPRDCIRRRVWKKTNGICGHCGKICKGDKEQTVDHILPKVRGGRNDFENLMPLCVKCNREKSGNVVDIAEYYKFVPKVFIEESIHYQAAIKGKQKYLDWLLTDLQTTNESV